jgi:8-oxo-dGTP pyrophosphatase MutT (NUDIX family)
MILQLESSSLPDKMCLYGENTEVIWKDFLSRYKLIEAAGGLVKNEKEEILFIFRRGKWDLPKGKLEKGESIKECAIREVEEECGIKHLKIIRELPSTFHTYELKGKAVLKRSYWYEMTAPGDQKLVPQVEEDITEIKWINKRELPKVLKNCFSSIAEVINNGCLIQNS